MKKDIIKNNILFLIGTILLTYKALFLNYILKLEFETTDIILYTILVSLLIMSPIINKRNKFAYIYLNITYAIITLIIYADFLYYKYSTNFLSFYQIQNMQYAKEIGSGLFSIIDIKGILLFWLDNIVVVILSILAYKKIEKTQYNNKILKIATILIIFILNIITVRGKINSIYETFIYNKSVMVQHSAIYYYHYEDFKDFIINLFIKENIDEQRLNNAYTQNTNEKEKTTKYTGIAKECNVIILQLESLNEYIIGKKVNGKEIMPNLNKFFKENIYASDMYNQGLGTTADSEFEMENSLYPLENGYVFQKYYNNTWLDIYTTLRNKGYHTSFMHPNTSTFWNREEVYKNGYHIDEYNDINKFPNIETAGGFYSDEGFFEEAVKIMNSYDKRFCTTLVSVTTHIPFYLTGISNLENKLTLTEDDVKNYKDEIYRNYILSCNFVDYAFGKLMEDLVNTGLLEKSIFIVYGDHGAGLTTIDEIQRLYQENDLEYTDFEDATKDVHIPFGIKIPGINESKIIERSLSKIDIKPTILDLLGEEDKFSIGTSIFTNKDYSFIKGLGYITSENYYINDKYYNRDLRQEIEKTDELIKLTQKMESEMYLSDTVIKNNLIEMSQK